MAQSFFNGGTLQSYLQKGEATCTAIRSQRLIPAVVKSWMNSNTNDGTTQQLIV